MSVQDYISRENILEKRRWNKYILKWRSSQKGLLKKVLQREGKWYQKEIENIGSRGRATEMVTIWVNIIDHSSLNSLKCLMVESKNYIEFSVYVNATTSESRESKGTNMMVRFLQ